MSDESPGAFCERVQALTGHHLSALPDGEGDDLLGGEIVARRGRTYVVTYGYAPGGDESARRATDYRVVDRESDLPGRRPPIIAEYRVARPGHRWERRRFIGESALDRALESWAEDQRVFGASDTIVDGNGTVLARATWDGMRTTMRLTNGA